MTDDEIRELLAMEAKATEGPWIFGELTGRDTSHALHDCAIWTDTGPQTRSDNRATYIKIDDARLIAATRNAIRPLAEEVLRLREFREQLASLIPFVEPDTGPQAVNDRVMLDAVRQRAVEVLRLREVLGELVDIQNGPPLIRDTKEWNEIMDRSYALLGRPKREQP